MPFGFGKKNQDEDDDIPMDRERFRALLDEDDDEDFSLEAAKEAVEEPELGKQVIKEKAETKTDSGAFSFIPPATNNIPKPPAPKIEEKKTDSGKKNDDFFFMPSILDKDKAEPTQNEDSGIEESIKEDEAGSGVFSFVPAKNEPLQDLPSDYVKKAVEEKTKKLENQSKQASKPKEEGNISEIEEKIARLEKELADVRKKLKTKNQKAESKKKEEQEEKENDEVKDESSQSRVDQQVIENNEAEKVEEEKAAEKIQTEEETEKEKIIEAEKKAKEEIEQFVAGGSEEEVKKETKEFEPDKVIEEESAEEELAEELAVSHKKKFLSRIENQNINELARMKRQAKLDALRDEVERLKAADEDIKEEDDHETIRGKIAATVSGLRSAVKKVGEKTRTDSSESASRKLESKEEKQKVENINKKTDKKENNNKIKNIKNKPVVQEEEPDLLPTKPKKKTINLREEIAGKKRLGVDASEAPSYQKEELDLRKKTKKKDKAKKPKTQKQNDEELLKEFRAQESKKIEEESTRILNRSEVKQKEIDDLYDGLTFSDLPKTHQLCEFPEGFLWGTSTSAYQVEGGIVNDWSLWEKGAKRTLKLIKKKMQPLDYICGQAVDAYNHFETDLDLAQEMGTNAIRFGLEWSRIQPRGRTWDLGEIKHYRRVLDAAKARGMKTVVTLWHWTNPLWFVKRGGWENEKNINYFKQYVKLATEEFGANVDYWVTLNEPMLWANYAYFMGYFPPNKHNYFKFKHVAKNLINAHIGAYNMIHRRFRNAQVSITNLSNVFEPNVPGLPTDILLTKIARKYGHDKFFKKIKNHIDYVGIDYYRKIFVSAFPPFIRNKSTVLTDMNWEIYPQGIYELLKKFSEYEKPIMILENGLADADDKIRAQFIKEHLYWIWKAIQEGVDVRGYFHWSLLDNFEWDKGFAPKFGLFEVDRKTFERKKRASADYYASIIKQNGLQM